MTNAEHVGITGDTPNRLIFDAGALYRDYGEAGEARIGATRGGSTFNVDREDREVEIDDALGPIKEMRRPIRNTANLEVTLVEYDTQLWQDIMRGTATSDGTHETVTPDNDIVSGDFYTNIALVAEVSGSSDPVVLKLLNALVTNEWDISTDDENEGELSITFEAHYPADDLATPPYRVLWPSSLS